MHMRYLLFAVGWVALQITRLYSYPKIVKISYVNYITKNEVVTTTTTCEDEVVTSSKVDQEDQSLIQLRTVARSLPITMIKSL
jgi:hypothetical protein